MLSVIWNVMLLGLAIRALLTTPGWVERLSASADFSRIEKWRGREAEACARMILVSRMMWTVVAGLLVFDIVFGHRSGVDVWNIVGLIMSLCGIATAEWLALDATQHGTRPEKWPGREHEILGTAIWVFRIFLSVMALGALAVFWN